MPKIPNELKARPLQYPTDEQVDRVRKLLAQSGRNPNFVLLPEHTPYIDTVAGKAKLFKIEIEDDNEKWNDTYLTRDGFWVIHKGKYHFVYKERMK